MTLQDLYEKTLQRLQITAANEAAEPEDTAVVAARYVGLYKLLRAENLVNWAQTASPPDEVEIPLVAMLACHCAREFSIVDPLYSQLLSEGGLGLPQSSWAERLLRSLMSRPYVATRAQSEYY
jgi:hypothetical protein